MATVEQLTHEVDALTEKVRQMDNLLGMFMVNGLQDAFDGTGNQTFGGGNLRLDKNGIQIGSVSSPAIFFVPAFTASPSAATTRASLDGGAIVGDVASLGLHVLQGSHYADLSLQADSTGLDYVFIAPYLRLEGQTADPTVFADDGYIWYRSDTDTFHVRANGLTKTVTVT